MIYEINFENEIYFLEVSSLWPLLFRSIRSEPGSGGLQPVTGSLLFRSIRSEPGSGGLQPVTGSLLFRGIRSELGSGGLQPVTGSLLFRSIRSEPGSGGLQPVTGSLEMLASLDANISQLGNRRRLVVQKIWWEFQEKNTNFILFNVRYFLILRNYKKKRRIILCFNGFLY